MSTERVISKKILASTENISSVRTFVSENALQFGFTGEEVSQIELAVDEACTNVIKHAYGYDNTKSFLIKILPEGHDFTVIISDEGRSFNENTYQEPNIEERIKMRKGGGVGVFLIHKLMDKVEYRKQGSLNEIVLTKKL